MALPYDTQPPFGTVSPFSAVDPALEAEMLATEEAAAAAPPEPEFPATQPFLDRIDAEIEADLAAQQAPSSAAVPEFDFTPAQAAKERFEAMEQEMAGVPQQDTAALDAEIMGLPAPEFQADADGIAQRNIQAQYPGFQSPEVATLDTGEGQAFFPADQSLGVGTELSTELPIAPDYAQEEVAPVAAQDLNDEALYMRDYEQRVAQQDERDRLEREAAEKDAQRKLENAQVYEQRLAEADARAEELFTQASELARQKIDRGRYIEDKSWGQKAAGIFAVLAGGQLGLMSGRGGNEAMDLLLREIDKDVEEQRLNLENQHQALGEQRGLVADLYRQSGNAFQASETARLAMYEAASAEVEAQMARLNPDGMQAVAKEQERRKLFAARDAQRAKMAAVARREAMEAAKFDLETRDTNSQIAKRNVEAAAAAKKAGLIQDANGNWVNRPGRGGGQKKIKPPSQSTLFSAFQKGIGWSPERGYYYVDGKPKDDKAAVAMAKLKSDADKAAAEAKISGLEANSGPGGNPYAIGDLQGNPLKQKDGSIFAVPNATTRQKLSSMYAAAANIRRIADLAAILREKDGGASEIVGSKEYQELTSLAAGIDFETYKAFDLGAPSAGDQKMAADARGGKDITSWIYDASKGWDAYARNVERKLDAHFRIEGGYTGGSIKIPRKKVKKGKERTDGELEKDIDSAPLDGENAAEFMEDKRLDMITWLTRGRTRPQLASRAKKIEELRKSGRLSDEDAMGLVYLMSPQWQSDTKGDWRDIGNVASQRGFEIRDPTEFYAEVTGRDK